MKPALYLDNAATSWPKPEETFRAVERFMRECGGTPARGRHPKAEEAGRVLATCRERLARLLGAANGYRLVLTSGATEALNLAIKGLLCPRDHVVVTELEHNSVLRPLMRLVEDRGVELSIVEARPDGTVDPARVREALRPHTRLVAFPHASNVVGTKLDLEGLVAVAHAKGVPVLVDAAQTAGVVPIDVGASGVDLLAFTGHKSLLGPPATGGLIFREDLDLAPLKEGGTGTFGTSAEQPDVFPDRYESGSPNMYGIAGLEAGVGWVEARGPAALGRRKSVLVGLLLEEVRRVPGAKVYGTEDPARNVGIVSFNLDGRAPDDVAAQLWERAGIMVRAGHHCAPFAHRRLGTEAHGTVRVGVGFATTEHEIRALADALR